MELCESKGIKGAKMCTDVGISKGLLTDLKMGRRTGVSAVTAQKIASYFNVSVGYLLGEEEKEKPTAQGDGLSDGQKQLIEFAKSLSEDQAVLALRLLKSLVEAD
jgi:transcriptional regulator with XRE-family HTH domain